MPLLLASQLPSSHCASASEVGRTCWDGCRGCHRCCKRLRHRVALRIKHRREEDAELGSFLRSKESEGGINPKVITWYPATDQKSIRGTADGSRQILDFVASVWGPYPYSTLHIVESVPYPLRNWGGGETGSNGSWSCVPPGNLHAWQGVTTGPSGMLLSTSRTTAPAVDLEEARAIDRVLLEAAESGKYLSDRAPYQRGIMDAFSEPGVEEVVMMSSAQVGKTLGAEWRKMSDAQKNKYK